MKICSKCKEEKAITEYYLDKTGHPLSSCKSCRKSQASLRRNKIAEEIIKPHPGYKVCYACNTGKTSSEFYSNKYRVDGLTDECKDCSKEKAKSNGEKYSTGELSHEILAQKICCNCKVIKSVDAFNKNKRKPDGLSTECKSCVSEYGKQYRAMPENKEIAVEYNKIYREENKEELEVARLEYGKAHKKEQKIRAHIHYINNADKYHQSKARRRAKLNEVECESFTKTQIIDMYGDACFYCDGNYEHTDHYIPISKNGPHTLENVRPSCSSCNYSKHDKMPDEWHSYCNRTGRKLKGDK